MSRLARVVVIAISGLFLGCERIAGLTEHVLAEDAGAGLDAPAGGGGQGGSDGPAGGQGGSDGPPAVCKPSSDATMCPTGLGNCQGTGCVVSLTSDHENCGACGRSCRGGECQAGECLPVPIATNQILASRRQLAVSAAGIFWGTSDGFIKTVSFEPRAQPTTLAEGEGDVRDIVVDDEFAYVMTEGAVCGPEWCLRRVSLIPGKYPTTTLTDVGRYSGGMAVDASALYWFDSHGSIVRLPTRAPGLPTRQELAINQGPANAGTAIDREYIYWSTVTASEAIVKRTRLDGSTLTPQHLANGLQGAAAVGIDEVNVYWTNNVGGLIQMAPKRGGGPITTLAKVVTDDEGPPVAIAVDEVNVYWGSDGGHSGFRKVPKCGGKHRLASPPGGPAVFGIVPWKGNVYWNDNMSGLFRVAQ